MSELTSELQRMADDAAHQARPPAAADIIGRGERRRRRSLTRRSLGGLSAAGVIGAGVALGLGLAGSAPTGSTIRTAAFTLVANADGTATLTINPKVLLEPGTLQSDLARDGIPAMVTVGRFCSTNPAPAGIGQVVSSPGRGPVRAVIINPAAIPAGAELSFGNFQLENSTETAFMLIKKDSYTCTSTMPTAPPRSGALINFISA